MTRTDVRRMRRHMQFVLQNPYSSLHPRMTVGATLTEPLRVHRSVPATDMPRRVAQLLDYVGMDPGVAGRSLRGMSFPRNPKVFAIICLYPSRW